MNNKTEKFVDIHGRELSTAIVNKKGTIACLLTDLKQTGIGIYRTTQFEKLSTFKPEFGPDFHDHMLEAAKSYMLTNKIGFSEKQILESIQKSKNCIICNHNPQSTPQKSDFLKERKIQTGSDDEILVISASTTKQIQSPPVKNYSMKSPRQPPIGKESSSSEYDSNTKTPIIHKRKDKVAKKKEVRSKSPKRLQFDPKGPEHDVIVTKIDKPNCIWVRDIANNELFSKIHNKVNEAAKSQEVAAKPYELDKVYIAKDENAWFRCKLVKPHPLTVFFLDYGNIAEVDEIRDIPQDIAKLPFMAIRITFKTSEYTPKLEDKIRIKPFLKNDDGTLFVNILKNSKNVATCLVQETPNNDDGDCHHCELSTKKEEKTSSQETSIKIEKQFTGKSNVTTFIQKTSDSDDDVWDSPSIQKEKEFFQKPPIISNLENGQKVAIIYEENGVFYLRTKEGFLKLKEIEKSVEEFGKSAKNVTEVKIGQLVLFKKDRFYRAVVTKINGSKAEIELLDYGNSENVDLNTLKLINEDLSKQPITCICGGKLQGFETENFNDKSRKKVREYIKNRKKFTVSLGFDDELDLADDSGLLSDELKLLQNQPTKLYLKDMKTFKPQIGCNPYVLGCYRNSKDLILVPADELAEHDDCVLKTTVEDTEPYSPEIGEICLCYYVDTWYRCIVTRFLSNEFEVLLLDFGKSETVTKDSVRKATEDINDVPILALPCVLIDLPKHRSIEELLKQILIEGEIYDVEFKDIKDGKYNVVATSVVKKIEEKL